MKSADRGGEATARIMVVDDDPKVRSLHAKLLQSLGFEVEVAADGIEALALLPLGVDLVLLDGQMPNLDGFEVASQIRASHEYAALPIVMVTGLEGSGLHRRALEVGINDFIQKPVSADELRLRLRWLLELKRAHDRLLDQNSRLEHLVEERTQALRASVERRTEAERDVFEAHLDTIRRLAVAAELKDPNTAGHIERVGLYSGVLAEQAGLSPGAVETIRHAAPMHDVGKLGIPDHVLLKPGGLNPEEWAVMRSHAALGAQLLAGSRSEVLRVGERIARSHHERWDGAGYPDQLRGDAIPLEARVCAVVDYFDAVTMARPYRDALPVEFAVQEIRDDQAARFDPELRTAFLTCLPEILELRAGSIAEIQAGLHPGP